jgi:AcrR family transcriptional regulator
MEPETSTEERIKEAAVRIFMEKGMFGARMQDIADAAEINKAMLHYYFRTKRQLFEIVYREQFVQLFSTLTGIIFAEMPFEVMIRKLIHEEIEHFSKVPSLPVFVLYEGWQNAEIIRMILADKPFEKLRDGMQRSIEDAVARNVIRPIPAAQLLINIMSMVIYPLIAKPILKEVFTLSDQDYNLFIENRKEEVTHFVMQSLKPE